MLLNPFADFQMKAHLEKNEMQAFALVIAKGGVKLKLSEETLPDPNGAASSFPAGPPKVDKNGFPSVSGKSGGPKLLGRRKTAQNGAIRTLRPIEKVA